MEIPCFVMEGTDLYDVFLRIYETSDKSACSGRGFHDNSHFLYRKTAIEVDSYDPEDKHPDIVSDKDYKVSQGNYVWPRHCICGFEFTSKSCRQYFPKQVFKRQDTGELLRRDQFSPGALWRQPWLEDLERYKGLDGQSWTCLTPGGEWNIDGPCSNCTRPNEPHKCWCRHGTAPLFTVDKVGDTCSAGGGSIISGNYHGFLREGKLTNA